MVFYWKLTDAKLLNRILNHDTQIYARNDATLCGKAFMISCIYKIWWWLNVINDESYQLLYDIYLINKTRKLLSNIYLSRILLRNLLTRYSIFISADLRSQTFWTDLEPKVKSSDSWHIAFLSLPERTRIVYDCICVLNKYRNVLRHA